MHSRRSSAENVGRGRPGGAPVLSDEGGYAVIETALVIPVLLAVAGACMWCVSIATTAVAAGGAAGNAARSVARGEAWDDVAEVVRNELPGADVRARNSEGLVTVTVTRRVSAPFPVVRGLGFDVVRSASAPVEWSTSL